MYYAVLPGRRGGKHDIAVPMEPPNRNPPATIHGNWYHKSILFKCVLMSVFEHLTLGFECELIHALYNGFCSFSSFISKFKAMSKIEKFLD